MFFQGKGRGRGSSSVHARTNNTILFVILGYYRWNASGRRTAYGFYTQDGIRELFVNYFRAINNNNVLRRGKKFLGESSLFGIDSRLLFLASGYNR